MTTHIVEQIFVKCPTALAGSRISAFFRAHGNAAGDTAQLRLRGDADIAAIQAHFSIECDVIATLTPAYRPSELPKYRMTWASSEPGPFPLFSGELRVEAEEEHNAFWLVLNGHYDPPFGSLGATFDRIAGVRIAISCARNLLGGLANALESDRGGEPVFTPPHASLSH